MNLVDLENTPGWYYALSYCISSMLYAQYYPHKLHGLRRWLVHAVFLVLLTWFMIATDNIPVVYFIPCVIVEIVLIYTFLMLCCDFSPAKGGYVLVRAFILGEFSASLEWQLLYFGLTAWKLPYNIPVNIGFFVIMHVLVYGTVFLIERQYREGNSALQISRRELIPAAIIGLAVYFTSNLSYVYKNTPFSSQFTSEIFIIRTLVDLGGVVILFAYNIQQLDLNTRLEMASIRNILKMQYANYKISEETIELVNQKYHDLKHHIAMLRAEITSEEKLKSLDEMENEIKVFEAQNKTGNKVLDVILTSKSIQCQKHGISLTCVANGEELSSMQPIDISTLFGNALDNAIESVRKIEALDRRLIHVTVSRMRGFLCIRIENCCQDDIVFINGLPQTTKKNKQFHGYGIKGIQGTVNKYHGSVNVNVEDNWFYLRILIPVADNQATDEN